MTEYSEYNQENCESESVLQWGSWCEGEEPYIDDDDDD
jgi:hypothetical protein